MILFFQNQKHQSLMNKVFYIMGLLLFCFNSQAQEIDSSYVEIDSVSIDSIAVLETEIALINPDALICFYEKLAQIKSTDSNQKINFVHIGLTGLAWITN